MSPNHLGTNAEARMVLRQIQRDIYAPSKPQASSLQLRFSSKEHGTLLQRSGFQMRTFDLHSETFSLTFERRLCHVASYVSSTVRRTFSPLRTHLYHLLEAVSCVVEWSTFAFGHGSPR
jgi:hypothetical protein